MNGSDASEENICCIPPPPFILISFCFIHSSHKNTLVVDAVFLNEALFAVTLLIRSPGVANKQHILHTRLMTSGVSRIYR